jgi:hypothetical protein
MRNAFVIGVMGLLCGAVIGFAPLVGRQVPANDPAAQMIKGCVVKSNGVFFGNPDKCQFPEWLEFGNMVDQYCAGCPASENCGDYHGARISFPGGCWMDLQAVTPDECEDCFYTVNRKL